MATSRRSGAPAIGIDLGTTYSCVAVWRDDRVEIITNEYGNRTTPSCVAFTDAERLIGDGAINQITFNPNNTVYDAKRLIGRRFSEIMMQDDLKLWPFKVIQGTNDMPKVVVNYKGQEKQFTTEEISSMVLAKMKEVAETYIGETVKSTVITVPAYFNDCQRQSTKNAATIAGLKVMRMINEPTAAAVAYGVAHKSRIVGERNVLVFDLGGGTLLSIGEGSFFEVKAVAGDTHLGGHDFDNNLVSYCVEEFKNKWNKDLSGNKKALARLKVACEKAKIILSFATTTLIEIHGLHEAIDFSLRITRAKFEDLNMTIFTKCIKKVDTCLAYAKMNKTSVHEVILVGGSTRIPKVQSMLQEFFDGKELCKSINPDEAVAYGAAVMAAMLSGETSEILNELVLLDVTPLALGVEVLGEKMCVVIPRNTLIPTSFTKKFVTTKDYQSSIRFKVYQGERTRSTDNYLLGQLLVSGIPAAPKGVSVVEICFEIDANGILTVTGKVVLTGKTETLTVTNYRGRLSKQEIEKMTKDAEKFKVEDHEYKRKVDACNGLEDCLYVLKKKLKGDDRTPKVLKNMKYAYEETRKWLADNKTATGDEIEARKEYLEFVSSLAFSN
ncbi:putative Heat shock protein 70 family [Helianthus annuus]|nr:putative Heat shock protein 70 family [Helianthus annuus]KAJ0640524.1 putative Heat shock protein 70 family [Helianthus annuus]KAJ0644459.1 putative Heat shock protein 70 family [Helianthus annuus]KAJ0820802.1 putative Heat shock protein 70 family [Helianthus annuus]KAJ0835404.1 putative Heat shock protein 70 family [Helianthus annuus]